MSTADFAALLNSQREYLQPFAISLTRDGETAKDLCQETLYRALSNKDKYQLGTNLKSWLYTIMRNIFINDYRRKKKQITVPVEALATYTIPVTTTNPATTVLSAKEIEFAIYSLPEVFKKPFVLYMEGYKYNEIAEALDEPLGTIKSRIHFARKLLKEQVERN